MRLASQQFFVQRILLEFFLRVLAPVMWSFGTESNSPKDLCELAFDNWGLSF
jgi:hypothetical protein